MSDVELLDIARFCNCFPNIDMSYGVQDNEILGLGKTSHCRLVLSRIWKEGQRWDRFILIDVLKPKRKDGGLFLVT